MSNEKPKKVDPAYPSSDGLSKVGEAATGVLGAAAGLAVPVVGPAVVQAILKHAVQMPLELRRTNWFNSLGEGLRELQDRLDGFDPDRLGENEEFVSIVVEATQMTMRTSREEKRRVLRDVVLNVAAGVQVDDVLRGAFLGYVDRFSALHLRVLGLLADPRSNPAMVAKAEAASISGSLGPVLYAGIPEIRPDDTLLDRVVADLERERLADGANLRGMMTGSALLAKRSTEDGDAFLRFTSDPLAS